MNITEINISTNYRKTVDNLKRGFHNLFEGKSGDVYIVNHFPAATDGFGETELLIFINLNDEEGNDYFYETKHHDKYRVNNLVIGIKVEYEDCITDIDENSSLLFSSEGLINYCDALDEESLNLKNFSSRCLQPLVYCPYFYWISSKDCQKQIQNDYIILNSDLDVVTLLYSACKRMQMETHKIASFNSIEDLPLLVKDYIDTANKTVEIGILTKERINKITEKGLKTPLRILENRGKSLTILQGKAGSGKTLMLTRAVYNIVKERHHCRFLTYNHLLVFDLKHCLRNIGDFRNTNLSIRTIHHFFYQLYKDTGLGILLTGDRIKELMKVCEDRLDIADKYIREFYHETGKEPEHKIFGGKYNDVIDRGDYGEIEKYIYFLEDKKYKIEYLSDLRTIYVNNTKKYLQKEEGHKFFLPDYNKVLENLHKLVYDPEGYYDFWLKNNLDNRREFVNYMLRTDKVSSLKSEEEYDYTEFKTDIDKVIARIKWWSRSVLIDEAQDCNNYEKLILMKIYGPENIIISTGGKDQLIRTSVETDWTVALNAQVKFDKIPLGARSYRQKSNIVNFVNAFGEFYKLASPIHSANESKGLGRVILDLRCGIQGFSKDAFDEIRRSGKIMGCSEYENSMVLLPSTGYTFAERRRTINIDELDNVDIIETTKNRKLGISSENIVIWSGVSEDKRELRVPAAYETRFIYYESCRGLEAWNVLCVDLDSFFYSTYYSAKAAIYARYNKNLFSKEEELKKEYALHLVYMALTRPIDTLYIQLSTPESDFSKEIIEIAKNTNAEILSDREFIKR